MNDTTPAELQLQELCLFVHGVLAAFHVLGVIYNIKRRHWWHAGGHAGAALFDTHAVYEHAREVRFLRAGDNHA